MDKFLVVRGMDIQNIFRIFRGLGPRFDIGKVSTIPPSIDGANSSNEVDLGSLIHPERG